MKRIFALSALLVASLSVNAHAQTYVFSRNIGFGQLNGALGLSIDNSGNIFVGDRYNNRAVEFGSDGVFKQSFGSYGSGNGQLNNSWGVAVDKDGYVYVSDFYNNRVLKFNSTATPVLPIFGPRVITATANGTLSTPNGITIDNSGNLYVADRDNNRIVKFDVNGNAIQTIGSLGSSNGLLSGPRGAALDADGNIYVPDFSNNRIVKFSSNGSFLMNFGSYGNGNGQLIGPRGVAIDSSRNVYVADGNSRVVEFNSMGGFIQNIGNYGSNDGQIGSPAGLAFDHDGNLYVVDSTINRIVEFSKAYFTGTITLEGTDDSEQNITFQFRPTTGGTPIIVKQVLTPTGKNTGTFAIANIPDGMYNVAIKGACWLRKTVPVTILAGSPVNMNVTLPGADINNDNVVDVADFGILVNNYNNAGDP